MTTIVRVIPHSRDGHSVSVAVVTDHDGASVGVFLNGWACEELVRLRPAEAAALAEELLRQAASLQD